MYENLIFATNLTVCKSEKGVLAYSPSGVNIRKDKALEIIELLKQYVNTTDFKEVERAENLALYQDYIKPDIERSASLHKKNHINGCVYFLKRKDGLIKIGCSSKFENRIKDLQRKFGKLELIHLVNSNNMFITELAFHLLFEKKRQESEWFLLSDEDISYIKYGSYYEYIQCTILGNDFNYDLYYKEIYSKKVI